MMWGVTNALSQAGVPSNNIIFSDGLETTNLNLTHPTGLANLAGYTCWGAHSSLDNLYAVNGVVKWTGNSRWWLINTIESFNGQPHGGQGDFWMWFSRTAFGGTNYEYTPVGAVTHTDEPGGGLNGPANYLGLWASGKNFAICAWYCRLSGKFQAVGDPLVRR